MKFTCKIDMDNAAFQDPEGNYHPMELETLLDDIAEQSNSGMFMGKLYDSNGNKVGQWQIKGE